MRTYSVGAGLALAALVGCMRTPGGIAESTTPVEGRAYKVIGEASGAVTQYHILGIIPTGEGVRLKAAVEDAKKKAGADALIDVTVDSYQKYFVLFSTTTTEVHGKAIQFTN